MRKKWLFLWLLVILAAGLLGCARSVTEVITYGNELTVAANFRGTLDYANNTYYLILSTREAFTIPYQPYSPYEFIEPGLPPSDPSMDFYEHYRTWDGYVILGSSGIIWLVKGPFTSSAECVYRANQVQVGEYQVTSDNQWTFHFRVDQLYSTAETPTTIYFDLVAVDNSTKHLLDHLETIGYINTYRDSTTSGTNGENSGISAAADIRSYSAVVN